ncbi:MAG: nitronate monooxygenase family protein [Solirubrobacterales bacterium]
MGAALAEQLGIRYPLFAFSHSERVAAAVSRSGGLGVLGAAQLTAEELEEKLAWLDAELGDVPYGVDFLLPTFFDADTDGGGPDRGELVGQVPAEHRAFTQELLDEYEVPELAEGYSFGDVVDGGDLPITGNHTYTRQDVMPVVEVAMASNIKLFANALGIAPPDVIDGFHERDVLVAGLAGAPRHGEKHREAGTDVVICTGYEAGGHTGEIGSMVLIPDMVDACGGLPVLAGGGIASGRQMAAALVLGASGAWCGSVWLTTEESETPAVVKRKMVGADATGTVRNRGYTGKPARQLRTAWTDAWEDPGNPDPLPMPLQGILSAEPQVRITRAAEAGAGRADELVGYFVGQAVGRLGGIRPAAEVFAEIVADCDAALARVRSGQISV